MARQFSLDQTRNVLILAQTEPGQTTLAERLVLTSGRAAKACGTQVDDAAALQGKPYDPGRAVALRAIAASCVTAPTAGPFNGTSHRLNVVNTPSGLQDSTDLMRHIRAVDGTIAVFDSSNGGWSESIGSAWRLASQSGGSCLVFIDRLECKSANFDLCLASIKECLGQNAAAIQYPVGQGDAFRGVIDLVTMQVHIDGSGKTWQALEDYPIPSDVRGRCDELRQHLIEICALNDEDQKELFAGRHCSEITADELWNAVHASTLNAQLIPVVCGTSADLFGVQTMLDAAINYLPSPADVAAVQGSVPDFPSKTLSRKPSDDEPFAALVFKVANHASGTVAYFRVFSGTVASGASVLNSTQNKRVRFGRILRFHTDICEEVGLCYAGNIYAAEGLRDIQVGDTLCADQYPIILG